MLFFFFFSQEKFHKQVYGISISSSKSNFASAIIENPEMLKIQQRHVMKQQTLANINKPNEPPPPLISSTGTPTKQEASAVSGKYNSNNGNNNKNNICIALYHKGLKCFTSDYLLR